MLWAEMLGRVRDVSEMTEAVRSVPCVISIDAKSIYDCLVKRVQMTSLAEKRTALELLAYEKCIEEVGIITRWCHSEANLADSLTKASAVAPIESYMVSQSWSLVHDPEQLSAKKRKA